MALGGPTIWSWEGGFGSAGAPGWGPGERWWNPIAGALNPFRQTGELRHDWSVISEQPAYIPPQPDLEALEAERERLEAIANEQPFIPIGTIVLEPLDPSVVIGEVQGPDTPAQEDEEMAHDWGHLGRELVGGLVGDWIGTTPTVYNPPQSEFLAGPGAGVPATPVQAHREGCDGMAWNGGTPPKGYKVVNYCGQGVLRKIRRRRRRRILTASDAADIATIVGLVGKGQMASALINRRP